MAGEVVNIVRRYVEGSDQVVNTFLDLVSRRIRVDEAYIFGSYVKGTWIKGIDIDLVLISRDFEGIPFVKRLDMVNEIQWRAGIRPFIEVIPLTPAELARNIGESAGLETPLNTGPRSAEALYPQYIDAEPPS